jgi:bifunctional DNA-binding transcriptional regulator/antitoxin component of YhaV-PrlF toxin-antitoxin module
MARPDNDQTSLRKLSLVGRKTYAVSVPVDVIKQLGWQKGDVLIVRRLGKQITVERKDKQCAE